MLVIMPCMLVLASKRHTRIIQRADKQDNIVMGTPPKTEVCS